MGPPKHPTWQYFVAALLAAVVPPFTGVPVTFVVFWPVALVFSIQAVRSVLAEGEPAEGPE